MNLPDDIDDRVQLMASAAQRAKERADAASPEPAPACPKCAALEAEVARLREALRALVGHCDLGHTHAIDGRRQAYLNALDDAREALEKANG